MRFAEPGILFLLALPLGIALALIVGIWSRRRSLGRFGRIATVNQQLERPSPYLRAVKGIALSMAAAAMVLCAARPQYGGRIQMLKKRGIDIVVALDFSKSMLAQDIQPNRLERAKLELADFISRLTGDRIGLVAFAGDTMRFPLTSDYSAATAFWRGLGPYDMPVGGTAIGKALTAAARMLRPVDQEEDPKIAERSKVILLITDGEDHLGDPIAAAEEAAGQSVVIHVLGIGSDSPELIPRFLDDGTPMGYQRDDKGDYITTALTEKNEETLKEIAAKTQGRYFRAGVDFKGMGQVVEEIRKLKQSEVQARQITVYEEVFQWFLVPSFVLFLISFLLPERIWWIKRRNA
jgi:Ca-activated chloride channel family protein